MKKTTWNRYIYMSVLMWLRHESNHIRLIVHHGNLNSIPHNVIHNYVEAFDKSQSYTEVLDYMTL